MSFLSFWVIGAFSFRTWLMKPFAHVILSEEQKYFNYRLSGGRMVTEGAFGTLKRRWRIFYRDCESKKEAIKLFAAACIVLQNTCIDNGDIVLRKWDLTLDHTTNGRRSRDVARKLLSMRQCQRIDDTCAAGANIINLLKDKFWSEKTRA